MINLLPPEVKAQVAYSRYNRSWSRYHHHIHVTVFAGGLIYYFMVNIEVAYWDGNVLLDLINNCLI